MMEKFCLALSLLSHRCEATGNFTGFNITDIERKRGNENRDLYYKTV